MWLSGEHVGDPAGWAGGAAAVEGRPCRSSATRGVRRCPLDVLQRRQPSPRRPSPSRAVAGGPRPGARSGYPAESLSSGSRSSVLVAAPPRRPRSPRSPRPRRSRPRPHPRSSPAQCPRARCLSRRPRAAIRPPRAAPRPARAPRPSPPSNGRRRRVLRRPVRRRWVRPPRVAGGGRRAALGGWRAAGGGRPSAVGGRPSAVGGRPSAVGGRPSAVGGRRAALGSAPAVRPGPRDMAPSSGGLPNRSAHREAVHARVRRRPDLPGCRDIGPTINEPVRRSSSAR
jgi:hypothetical protein